MLGVKASRKYPQGRCRHAKMILSLIVHLYSWFGIYMVIASLTLHFRILSLIGLSLIALGTGGIKPCVAAFGGDQFEEKHVRVLLFLYFKSV